MNKQRIMIFGLLVLWGLTAHGAREQELLGILSSDAPLQQKARACQQLARVGGKASVPVLAALLGDGELGDYARFGLHPIDDPRVDDALRDAMGKLDGRFLVGVVNSIGVRRDTEAVEGLRALVVDPGKGAAPEALMALGMIATDEALATLHDALAGASSVLRIAAADAALVAAERLLAQKRDDEAIRLYDAVCDTELPVYLHSASAYGAIASRGEAGLPMLMAALSSEDSSRVDVALRIAREWPGSALSSALVAQFGDFSPAMQARLISVFVERQDAGARKGVEALAGSPDLIVQIAALTALGDIGDASSVDVLIKHLTGERETMAAATGSLKTIKGQGVEAAILAGLDRETGSARMALIHVLADRGCTGAAPALLKATSSEDEEMVQAAFKALGVLAGPGDVPGMLDSLLAAKSGVVAREAENAIGRVAGKNVDAVIAALDSTPSSRSRVSLVRVLGRTGGDRAYAAVTKAVTDPDPEVKDAAVRALAAWPDHRATGALLGIVKQTQNETHRVLALRGYVRLLDLDAATEPGIRAARLAEAMALSKTDDTRKAILGALAKVPHRDALELAMSQLNDKTLHAEAGFAAVTIARSIMGAKSETVRTAANTLADSSDQRLAEEGRGILDQLDRFADALTAWRISGPYMQAGKQYDALFDIVFEPEKPGAQNVMWQPIAAGSHPKYPQILDLRKALGGDQRVAYALTWIHSERAQPVRLEMGSDDGIKAWLNGRLVHAMNSPRAAIPYTDKVNVVLEKGWNPLLFKITQNNIPWEFCARFVARDGKPVHGIRIDPNHQGEWRLPGSASKRARRDAALPKTAPTRKAYRCIPV